MMCFGLRLESRSPTHIIHEPINQSEEVVRHHSSLIFVIWISTNVIKCEKLDMLFSKVSDKDFDILIRSVELEFYFHYLPFTLKKK